MINNFFFSTEILRWFRENGRELPWRETRDPYAIWLSEIILQQTRIAQGWEYWERFMQTYPQVEDLAAASEDDVLKLWQGLGYYSRARNLHFLSSSISSSRIRYGLITSISLPISWSMPMRLPMNSV